MTNDATRDLIISLLREKLEATVLTREPGHCIRVDDVPKDIAEEACTQLAERLSPQDEAVVVSHARSLPCHRTPTQVVELRNRSDTPGAGILVVFVPPNELLSVEDSIGSSTFERVSVEDLGTLAWQRVLDEIEEGDERLARQLRAVGDILLSDHGRFGIEADQLPGYAIEARRLLAEGVRTPVAVAGVALPALGLLPDASLGDQEDDDATRRRLELNAQQMDALVQPIAPADRVRDLPVDPESDSGLVELLLEAVKDGSTDRDEVAKRLASQAAAVDLSNWELNPDDHTPDRFEVTRVLGAERVEGEYVVTDDQPSLGLEFISEPAARLFPGASLRLEVISLASGGDEGVVKRIDKKSQLPGRTKGTFRRKLTCGQEDSDLRPGLYLLRLSLLSHDGRTLGSSESEHFRVGEIERDVTITDDVRSPFEARLRALAKHKRRPGPAAINVDGDSHQITAVNVSFTAIEGVQWPLDFEPKLLDAEADLLTQPDSVRGRIVNFAGEETELDLLIFDEPSDHPFLAARRRLFAQLQTACRSVSPDTPPTLLHLDLVEHEAVIKDYLDAWAQAVRSEVGGRQFLESDRVELRSDGALHTVLLSPTHPLRLAWRLRHDQVAADWLRVAEDLDLDSIIDEAAELLDVVPDLVGDELPLIVTHGAEVLRYRGPLPGGWVSYESAVRSDHRSDLLDYWLDGKTTDLRRSGERELVARVRGYLEAHPYVGTLVLNVVQAGRGDFVLRLLAELARTYGELRYVVRFFGDSASMLSGVALDEFMTDPESVRLPTAARDLLSRSGGDPLRPRLAFSKHTFDDLHLRPSDFPAHVTVFLDYFNAEIITSTPPADRRSIFAGGLITGALAEFRSAKLAGEGAPRWISLLAPGGSPDDLFRVTLEAHESATARAIGSDSPGAVPAVRLELDVRTQAILDAVHESSDWVVIVDPIFSDHHLDPEFGGLDQDRYVVDVRDIRTAGESRNVVVSSKLRSEQAAALGDAATHFGIQVDDSVRATLLDGLHILGAGLGLRLLADNTRRIEAFSLALASDFLRHQGFLRHALVIPVDEYPELVSEARARGEITSLSRTDLLIVRLDPSKREIAATLVEVKVRDLGESGAIPQSLADDIKAQLENSEPVVLNRLFAAHLRDRRDSLAAALRLRRLTEILQRHLARAERHRYLPTDEAEANRHFINDLDTGFTLSLDMRALIFNTKGGGSGTQRIGGIDIDVIGSQTIFEFLHAQPPEATKPPPVGKYLRTVIEARSNAAIRVAPAVVESGPVDVAAEEVSLSAAAADVPGAEENLAEVAIGDVDLIGHATTSSQFSVIGQSVTTGRPAAIDVGGTNVVALFGVQGSGKSYTAGVIVEAGLVGVPQLGPLPNPLATVVFHYSSDSSYRSEFASMVMPSDRPVETPWAATKAAAATPLGEILVLVPARQLAKRRVDYPDAAVEPLEIGTTELTAADWKLLMGISGGNQMYAKALNQLLRSLPADFTLADMRSGIDNAGLSDQQARIANQRVDFVDEYLSDSHRIVDAIRPGRLTIVDLRDEYIDKDEALSLFMVLLNRFAEAARPDSTRFNKMIVFDEAHKYMRDTTLTDAITEAVREMRHKGVTLVVASQDPPSIPPVMLELSTVIVCHKMTAPTWLKHIQKHNSAFAAVRTGEVAQLRPGTAFLWSAGGSSRYQHPERIQTRARLTEHGGGTVRADE